MHAPSEESTIHQHQMNMVFANHSKEDVIFPFSSKGNCTGPGNGLSPEETNQDGKVFNSSGRGHKSSMQRWQDGHPQSSSA